MYFPSLLFAGSLAAQAVSAAVIQPLATRENSVEIDQTGSQAHIELDCPNCPFAAQDGNGSAWMHDAGEVRLVRLSLDCINDRHTRLKLIIFGTDA